MIGKYDPANPANRVRLTPRWAFSSPAHALAVFFGAGLLRPAPGTWGTLAGVLVYGLLHPFIPTAGWIVLTALLFAAGCWACEKSGRDIGVCDHGGFVVDEVAAVWALCIALPAGWGWWAAAFALFRLFDIVKIWPGSWIDRRVKTGFGVMLDDLVAALYAWAAIQILLALYWSAGRLAA